MATTQRIQSDELSVYNQGRFVPSSARLGSNRQRGKHKCPIIIVIYISFVSEETQKKTAFNFFFKTKRLILGIEVEVKGTECLRFHLMRSKF